LLDSLESRGRGIGRKYIQHALGPGKYLRCLLLMLLLLLLLLMLLLLLLLLLLLIAPV
jgi:hypothetical protein